MSLFGKKIKDIRTEKGLSIRETAKRSDISHPYLSQLENGKRGIPTIEVIIKLANGLNVNLDQLLKIAGHSTERQLSLAKTIESRMKFEGEYPDLAAFISDNSTDIRWQDKLLTIEERQQIVDYIQENIIREKNPDPIVIDIENLMKGD